MCVVVIVVLAIVAAIRKKDTDSGNYFNYVQLDSSRQWRIPSGRVEIATKKINHIIFFSPLI